MMADTLGESWAKGECRSPAAMAGYIEFDTG